MGHKTPRIRVEDSMVHNFPQVAQFFLEGHNFANPAIPLHQPFILQIAARLIEVHGLDFEEKSSEVIVYRHHFRQFTSIPAAIAVNHVANYSPGILG